MAGELVRSGIPSPCSVPLQETDRINAQRAAAAGKVGDICSQGAGGWTPTATAAKGVRMVIAGGGANFKVGESVTPLLPGVRIRYAAPSGSPVVPGTKFYVDAAIAGGLNTTVNGDPVCEAVGNSKGVFEGVLQIL